MIRAVLDANVVISGTIAPLGAGAAILEAWRADYFEVVTCPTLLAEIAEKLRLPRIRKKYPIAEEDVVNLLQRFSQAAYLVPGLAAVTAALPDPDDTMLFSAAQEGDANYIVTGDKPLLAFAWQGPGRIVSPRQFWEDELPHEVVRALSYPVFGFDDLSATGFVEIGVEPGRSCVALFTTQQAAELFRRKRNMLVELKAHDGPRQLSAFLKRAADSGCTAVALNPIGHACITEPMERMMRALEQSASSPG